MNNMKKIIALVFIVALVPLTAVMAQDDTAALEEANKELVRQFFTEVFTAGEPDAFSEFLSPDFIDHELPPGMEGMTDAEAVAFGISELASVTTDFEFVIIDMVAEGDKVAIIGTWTGTHSGDYMGNPATGNEFEIPVFDLVRVEDGLIMEHWGVTDNLAFGMAFGMIPPMEEGM